MIDLEDLRRAAFAVQGMSGDPTSVVRMGPADALSIADELEEARKVVEQARRVVAIFGKDGALARAIAAYDLAVGQ